MLWLKIVSALPHVDAGVVNQEDRWPSRESSGGLGNGRCRVQICHITSKRKAYLLSEVGIYVRRSLLQRARSAAGDDDTCTRLG